MRQKIIIGSAGLLLVIVFVAISIYIQRAFVFNPLTFRQDSVTHAQWREYKYPIRVEYLVDDDGWKLRKATEKSEVKFVLSQLKKAKPLTDEEIAGAGERGKRVVIVVRRILDSENGQVLLLLDSSEGSRVATLRTTAYHRILLTEDLAGLIAERLGEAEMIGE
ncbi:MAG: hypothetical protein QME41_06290 [Actinomycetota bacterium]|nr:hypothetical protein [Actinomycetota bacterium]